jgi:hypothetical protein
MGYLSLFFFVVGRDRLAPEVAHYRPFWSYAAGAAGGVIGYVVGNVPGMLAGGECDLVGGGRVVPAKTMRFGRKRKC